MPASQRYIRHCPQCSTETLSPVKFSNALIDRCPKCQGLWLDDGELQAIVKEYGTSFRISDAAITTACQFLDRCAGAEDAIPIDEQIRAHALQCPICDAVCFPTFYGFDSGIVINRCHAGHGVYLDNGELEAIMVYSARSFGLVTSISGSLPVLDAPSEGKVTKPNSSEVRRRGKRRQTLKVAPPLENAQPNRLQPLLATLRSLKQPVPIDVRLTISRKGNIFFQAIRSPQGEWFPVVDGGTSKIPELSLECPHYWVELKSGGALVIRQRGLHFEWVLVGASRQQ